ncbi:ATP-dependent RNA helicase DHX30-like isoform X1 [Metopolophium dirhodum]|uniref:ATP-dependent RNA helicase DHX30-like isoform X1 n=1 Tax=Metopolophium dirhodum TaxID=44670 RepID=UPI002990374F|nr:ATP-dependent RNA helicase DHX30-like isoform X1 [Metopolophium dirhodum]
MFNVRSFIGLQNVISRFPTTRRHLKLIYPQFSTVQPESEYKISDEDITRLKRKFASPRNIVSNFYNQVERTQNIKTGCHFGFNKNKKNQWTCKLSVQWPNPIVFSSMATTKAKAGETVSLNAIQWLQDMEKLDHSGKPLIVSNKQRIDVASKPIASIDLSEQNVKQISSLVQKYTQEIKPLINKGKPVLIEDDQTNEDELNFVLPPFSHFDYTNRNEYLYKNSTQTLNKLVQLPIDNYELDILDMIENNQVTIIKGEPGCGKSTRVPNFIMKKYSKERKGSECNVYVTQPRRISALTLANRVAVERSEELGNVVGFQVRLKQILPRKPGTIVFASSGILLQKLQADPGLKEFSHVIIDEAHEQDINTEILLMLTKNALQLNDKLKLIIMSATLNAEHFQNYYGHSASTIEIPGFTHPVKTQFLSNQLAREWGIYNTTVEENGKPYWNPQLVASVIKWIHSNKSPGAILCFVSGWQDIIDVNKLLQKRPHNFEIMFAHSKLTPEQQIEIMNPASNGRRKVVLATNIAETSITINDVVYVVDTGMQNISSWNAEKGIKLLDRCWVSQANAKQRRGRAGRTQPGECYHLYTLDRFNNCSEYPTPEIQLTPLEHTIINLKIHSQDKARVVLSKLLNSPSVESIDIAVSELQLLGALDREEKLTALGKRIAAFPFDPCLSKALVNSVFLKCLDSTLTIITYLSSNVNIFKETTSADSRIIKKEYSSCSDHLAVAKIFSEWNSTQNRFNNNSNSSLSRNNLILINKLKNLFTQHLYNSMLIEDKDMNNFNLNSEKSLDQLIPAVLISGFGNLVFKKSFMRRNGRLDYTFINDAGIKVIQHSESVNYNKDKENELLTYFREGRSLDNDSVMLNKSTYVPPILAVLFFNGQASFKHDGHNNCLIYIQNGKRVNISCSKGDWETLLSLRNVLRSFIDFLMETYGHYETNDQSFDEIMNFRDSLCSVLCKLVEK